jgi:hypothetical protein
MSVTLIIAEEHDRLAQQVCDQLRDVVRCTEQELFANGKFALLQDGTLMDGTISVCGDVYPFAHLSGVLFRSSGRCRPRAGLSAANRVFVRHETQAAWCAVLNALPCPVLNRMPPAWWFDHSLYLAYLAQTFARQLGVVSLPINGDFDGGGVHGTPSTPRPATVYAVGQQFVAPRSTPHALRSLLAERPEALVNWQRETGIGFARIDFAQDRGYAVRRVEPMPSMGRAPGPLRQNIGKLIAEALG